MTSTHVDLRYINVPLYYINITIVAAVAFVSRFVKREEYN